MRFPNGLLWEGNVEGKGLVWATQEDVAAHSAEAHKSMFSWTSTFTTGAVDKEVLSFQNDESAIPFHVWGLSLSASGAAVFTLGRKTSGTPAGTTISAVNRYLGSGQTFDHTAFGDAEVTGSVAGDAIGFRRLSGAGSTSMNPEGHIIVPNGECIFVSCSTDVTVHVVLVGYWHE